MLHEVGIILQKRRMNFLLPRKNVFFTLFKDMQGLIQEMSDTFSQVATEFKDFDEFTKKAKYIESKGDAKTREIITLLNKTFITPIDREDIYFLTNDLDDIIDLLENAIRNIELYRIDQNLPAFSKFADQISKASKCLGTLLDCLAKGKHTQELEQLKITMHEFEDQADWIFEGAIERLFRETDAITIIKLKDILENLENVMDKFQEVADVIEGILVKVS